ncbi:MAG: hypothetical protein ACQCN4_11410 [Candidatus Bathyarchaeia archaeon]|jgi:hypothetical protein
MSEKTYKLSLKDRVNLLEILPREGNIITLRVIRELQSSIGFSEAEIADYQIELIEVGTSGRFRTSWNERGKSASKNIKIGPKAEKIIVERLEELNNKKILPFQMLDLYERFVEQKSG